MTQLTIGCSEKAMVQKLKKVGFRADEDSMYIKLPGNDRKLVYVLSEKKLYLSNVFLNFLRDIKTFEQINDVYKSLTKK